MVGLVELYYKSYIFFRYVLSICYLLACKLLLCNKMYLLDVAVLNKIKSLYLNESYVSMYFSFSTI